MWPLGFVGQGSHWEKGVGEYGDFAFVESCPPRTSQDNLDAQTRGMFLQQFHLTGEATKAPSTQEFRWGPRPLINGTGLSPLQPSVVQHLSLSWPSACRTLSSKEPWKKCCYGGPEDGAQRQQTLFSPYSLCQSTKRVGQVLAMASPRSGL